MGGSVDHRQRPGPWFGSGLASDRRRRHCVLPGHRRLDRSAVRGTGQRLRLRCACGVLAAPAIRRAGHRPIAEPGLALVRQPAGLDHCLDGDRSPVRLCLGPAREGAAHKTADHGGARITEARRFVPGPNSGIDSVPKSMYAAFAAAGLGQLSAVWGAVSAASGASERLFALLKVQPEITAPASPPALPAPAPGGLSEAWSAPACTS